MTFKLSYDFSTLRISNGCFPEFRFISNLMYGRWMLLLASSVVCRRSTSFFREVACAERVPAENRAMNSCNCAIFFSRLALSASMRPRICVLATTISSYPPTYMMMVS